MNNLLIQTCFKRLRKQLSHVCSITKLQKIKNTFRKTWHNQKNIHTAALMPDAHSGYGLPIGGVLATDNAVIPYGVGVDIGCRMCLSVFDIDPKELLQKEAFFTRELKQATLFGGGRQFYQTASHELVDGSGHHRHF